MIYTGPVVDGTCNDYYLETPKMGRQFMNDMARFYLFLFAAAMVIGAVFFITALIFSRPSAQVEKLTFSKGFCSLNGTVQQTGRVVC